MPTLDWLNRATAFTAAAQVPYRPLDNVNTHGDAFFGWLKFDSLARQLDAVLA